MSRDTPCLRSEVRVDYVSIMSFTISRRAHWLRSPEGRRLIEVASQHLEVNVGVFACASVGSSEWFTYKISPCGHRERWQARISLEKNPSLPIIHRQAENDSSGLSCRSNATLDSLRSRSVVRRCVLAFCRSVPVWTVYLPPAGGQPHLRQELRVRRPPVRGHQRGSLWR